MAEVVIPVIAPGAAPRLQVSVHVQTEVIAPEVARKRANVWLLDNAGNLLRAETPVLVLGEQLFWRMDVVLTSPSLGTIGRVGRLEIDAVTGEVLADTTLADTLIADANNLSR